MRNMTTGLKNILKRVEKWPKKRQEDAMAMLITMEKQDKTSYHLTAAQIKEVESIQRDLKSGKTKLLTDKQVAAMWKSFGV